MQPPRRVAIDARYVTARPSGIAQACCAILRGLLEVETPYAIDLLVDPATVLPDTLAASPRFGRIEAAFGLRDWRNQTALPVTLRRHGTGVLHCLDCFGPLFTPGVARLVTVHDIIPITHAAVMHGTRKVRWLPVWRAWLWMQYRSARALASVSAYTAGELSRHFGIAAERIKVIPNGVREAGEFGAPPDLPPELAGEGPLILSVGRHDPHKNFVTLVRAVALLNAELPAPARLLIAGTTDPRYPEVRQTADALGIGSQVHLLDFIDDPLLGALYRRADCYVIPSLAEGFGIPPLEAMRFGTPVVASDRPPMPEVLGDAALFVDPLDAAAMAGAIARVLRDPATAARLRRAGESRVAGYGRVAVARRYADLYGRLLPPAG